MQMSNAIAGLSWDSVTCNIVRDKDGSVLCHETDPTEVQLIMTFHAREKSRERGFDVE